MSDWNRDEVLEDDRHLLHPLQHPSDHQDPTIFVKGEGVVVTDIDGNEYLDGLSSLWNVTIGHGREELADAAAEQMKQLAYFSAYVGCTNVPAARLAKRLAEVAPDGLNTTFFTTGGAVSNDSAIKTARFFWQTKGRSGKVKVISRHDAYHGVTLAAMNLTGISSYWPMFESQLPNFLHVQAPYPYHYTPKDDSIGCGEAAARALEEAILREGPETVAAFIGEPVMGAGGVIVPPDDYWPRVREICDRYEVLLIADEVITGFGRIGHWFGISHWSVVPDMITFAKGVTSGYFPLGGIIISDEILEAIETTPPDRKWNHSFTYSGHPAGCAVGLKNMEIIEREELVSKAKELGLYFMDKLRHLDDLSHVGDIRGIGLMAAVELVKDRSSRVHYDPAEKIGSSVVKRMMDNGVYTRGRGDSVSFAPPLIVSRAQIDQIVDTARDAIVAVTEG
jgi:putrescine---pyruvate transaminase